MGAFDFIIKPFKPKQLVPSIEKAFNFNKFIQMEKDYNLNMKTPRRKRTGYHQEGDLL